MVKIKVGTTKKVGVEGKTTFPEEYSNLRLKNKKIKSKDPVRPDGWTYLHGLSDRNFSDESGRYKVVSHDYNFAPSFIVREHVDSFRDAKKKAEEYFKLADRVEVWDTRRTYMVAFME